MKKIYVIERIIFHISNDWEDRGSQKSELMTSFNDKRMAINFINEKINTEINEINNSEYNLKDINCSDEQKSYTFDRGKFYGTTTITFKITELDLN